MNGSERMYGSCPLYRAGSTRDQRERRCLRYRPRSQIQASFSDTGLVSCANCHFTMSSRICFPTHNASQFTRSGWSQLRPDACQHGRVFLFASLSVRFGLRRGLRGCSIFIALCGGWTQLFLSSLSCFFSLFFPAVPSSLQMKGKGNAMCVSQLRIARKSLGAGRFFPALIWPTLYLTAI